MDKKVRVMREEIKKSFFFFFEKIEIKRIQETEINWQTREGKQNGLAEN